MGNDVSRNLQPAQGATAVACVAGISAAAMLFPDKINTGIPHLASFIHLVSTSTWFGIHFWVTFVAGLTKMKLLPRHLFGLVQSHLFPKSFLYGICLTTIATTTFIMEHPVASWNGDVRIRAWALLINLGSTLANYFIVEPPMTRYMIKEHKLERENGHGDEVGPITDKSLLENTQYKELRKNFFILHGISTSFNLIGYSSMCVYFWFMSRGFKL
eukprot:gene11904-13138_t